MVNSDRSHVGNVRTKLLRELAKVSLFTYLLFLATDIVFTGFVSRYLNMLVLLLPAIVFGVLGVIFGGFGEQYEKHASRTKISLRKWSIFVAIAGLFVFLSIWIALRQIGIFSVLVAGISSVVVVALLNFLMTEEE